MLTTVGIHNCQFPRGSGGALFCSYATDRIAFTLVTPFCVCHCLHLLDLVMFCFLSANASFRIATNSHHLMRIRASQNLLAKGFSLENSHLKKLVFSLSIFVPSLPQWK